MLLKKSLFRMMGIAAATCSLAGAAVGLTVTAVSENNAKVASAEAYTPEEYCYYIKADEGITLYLDSEYSVKLSEITDNTYTLEECEELSYSKGITAIANGDSEEGYKITIKNAYKFSTNLYYEFDPVASDSVDAHWEQSVGDTNTVTAKTTYSGAGQISVKITDWTSAHGAQGGVKTQDAVVVLTANVATHTVTLPSSNEYYFTSSAEQGVENEIWDVTVNHNDSTGTTVYLHAQGEGFTVKDATLRVNGVSEAIMGNAVDGKSEDDVREFTLKNITSDKMVTVSGVARKTYTITKGSESNYTINGKGTVTHGDSYTFTVSVDTGYEIEKVTYSMGNTKDTELTAASGTYMIPEVTGNVTIKVAVDKQTFVVNFPTNPEGYKIVKYEDHDETAVTGRQTLGYGEYKFKIEVSAGYTGKPTVHYVTSADATDPTEQDGVWTLTVVGAGSIEVSGIIQEKYTIKGESDTGYTYVPTSSTTVNYDGSFSFNVTAKPGYKTNGYDITVTSDAEGNELTATESGTSLTDSMRNYTVTGIKGNVIINITANADAAITYTITDTSTSQAGYTLQVKIGDEGGFSDLAEQTIPYGVKLEIKVEKSKGYTLGSISVTPTAHLIGDVYTIDSVTQNVRITVLVTENTLTVNYYTASGAQDGDTDIYTYTQLAEGKNVRDASTLAGVALTYFNYGWSKNGENFSDTTFNQSVVAESSVTYNLYFRYTLNVDKAKGLFGDWEAKDRDDNEGSENWSADKSYIRVKMVVDTEQWQTFLLELKSVNGVLSAVGFTYANSGTGFTEYTDQELKGYVSAMALATGDASGRVSGADKMGDGNRQMWLYGFRWTDNASERGNQVQFIKGLNQGAKRHVGFWFIVTINTVTTVINSDTKIAIEVKAEKNTPAESALPVEAPSVSDEEGEAPTIE